MPIKNNSYLDALEAEEIFTPSRDPFQSHSAVGGPEGRGEGAVESRLVSLLLKLLLPLQARFFLPVPPLHLAAHPRPLNLAGCHFFL